MAKSSVTSSAENSPKPKKQPGAGAAVGSVFLFLLTFLSALLLLVSASLHSALKQNAPAEAVSKMDFSAPVLTEDGTSQNLGKWVHYWYMWNSQNLTQEYGEAVMAQPEINAYFAGYLSDLGDYLLKNSDELPQISADELCNLLQYDLADTMQEKTGVVFAEADRTAILYNAEEDVAEWNQELQESIGHGFGKFAARFFCGLSGVIVFGILTVVFFVLWLIFATKGHWRKGRMLTAFGCAVAIPSLMALVSCAVLVLFSGVFHVIPPLAGIGDGLGTLFAPIFWNGGAIALCGMIFASIGICTNSVVKSKQKKAQLAAAQQPVAPAAAAAPEPIPAPPVYTEIPAQSAPVPEPPAGTCPHCGAQNDPGSKFCGSCGGAL